MWKDISQFLGRFSTWEPSETIIKKALMEVVAELVKIQLTKENLSIKNKTIFIDVSSGMKSQIFLQRKKIVEKTNHYLGNESLVDIR